MKYVISFYNQTAAGPQNLASTFLAVLERDAAAADDYFVFFPKIEIYSKLFGPRRGRIKIFFIPHFAFGNQMLSILIYDFLMLPFIVALINPKAVLIFGSLAPVPFFFKKKITLVHHPYLVDDGLLASLGPGRRLVENAKRFIFYLTAKAGGIFVVETENMKQNLTRKYGIRQDLINVIGNSVGETFYRECSGSRAAFSPAPPRRNYLFYPSRFNRHKNHRFIMEIARDFSPYFESNGLKFYITVDGGADKEAENYLRAVKAAGLDKIIVNLGEMPNEKLCAYYRGALGLFSRQNRKLLGFRCWKQWLSVCR